MRLRIGVPRTGILGPDHVETGEPQIKLELGKLLLRLPPADVLPEQQQQNGLVLEAVTRRHSCSFGASIKFTETRSTAL